MIILVALIVLASEPPAAPRPAKTEHAPDAATAPAADAGALAAPKLTDDAGTSAAGLPAERSDGGTAEAPEHAAASTKSADAPAEGTVVPPSLGKKGLCGEFVKTGKELAAARRKLDEDRRAVELERLSLDKLRAELTEARLQLRAETERLEALLAKRKEESANEPSERPATSAERPRPATPPSPKPQDLDGLARTMKAMRPDAAAALLMKTEPTLGAGVLRRMKPADAGAILDRLKPDVAADLMAVMATLPTTAPTKGGRP